jgi:hypothetical protein
MADHQDEIFNGYVRLLEYCSKPLQELIDRDLKKPELNITDESAKELLKYTYFKFWDKLTKVKQTYINLFEKKKSFVETGFIINQKEILPILANDKINLEEEIFREYFYGYFNKILIAYEELRYIADTFNLHEASTHYRITRNQIIEEIVKYIKIKILCYDSIDSIYRDRDIVNLCDIDKCDAKPPWEVYISKKDSIVEIVEYPWRGVNKGQVQEGKYLIVGKEKPPKYVSPTNKSPQMSALEYNVVKNISPQPEKSEPRGINTFTAMHTRHDLKKRGRIPKSEDVEKALNFYKDYISIFKEDILKNYSNTKQDKILEAGNILGRINKKFKDNFKENDYLESWLSALSDYSNNYGFTGILSRLDGYTNTKDIIYNLDNIFYFEFVDGYVNNYLIFLEEIKNIHVFLGGEENKIWTSYIANKRNIMLAVTNTKLGVEFNDVPLFSPIEDYLGKILCIDEPANELYTQIKNKLEPRHILEIKRYGYAKRRNYEREKTEVVVSL